MDGAKHLADYFPAARNVFARCVPAVLYLRAVVMHIKQVAVAVEECVRLYLKQKPGLTREGPHYLTRIIDARRSAFICPQLSQLHDRVPIIRERQQWLPERAHQYQSTPPPD